MYWQMFNAEDDYPANSKNPMKDRVRLHLVAELEDLAAGPGTSFGYIEQTIVKDDWMNTKRNVKLVVHVNHTHPRQTIDVPDLETGMAVLMMNMKGDSNG